MINKNIKICIVGLGYVGLPLAIEFSKKYNVVGYDINQTRIDELSNGIDRTLEVSSNELDNSNKLKLTYLDEDIKDCNIYIITVPTPIDEFNNPNLKPLILASELIGNILNEGDYVIYESTVYPGATEEICIPILENFSDLTLNIGFYVGYSPERINPGDKENTLTKITKVTSGSNKNASDFIDNLYSKIITAGTFKASSIKVAEAAKVIENTQRDLNIALINELSIIFSKMGIETHDVLEAAGTKWNFLPFKPGLVGGHCIGVDPYYLTHKAQSIGHHPEVILAGRRLNDSMGKHVATLLIKSMIKKDIQIHGSRILILGLAFKENCPDLRNTKVIDIINELDDYKLNIDVHDPHCDADEANNKYGIELKEDLLDDSYDAIIIAVAHSKYIELGISPIKSKAKTNSIIFDLKNLFNKKDTDLRL